MRVSTATRRRPPPSFSRVYIPPAVRTAPRSISVSLSVLRPRAHRGASDRQSLGFSPCEPAVEDPYDIVASTDLSTDADADDLGFVLRGPFVEDPFELATTTGLGEGADDEGDADLVLRVPTVDEPHEVIDLVLHMSDGEDPHELTVLFVVARDNAGLVRPVPTVEEPRHEVAATTDLSADDGFLDLRGPFVEYPFELVATKGLGEGAHDEGDADLFLRVPTVDEPHEVAALVLHVSAGDDPHELTATTDLCVVARDDAGLVLYVPTVEEPHEVAATTGPGDVAHDDCFVYPSRLTIKDLDEYEATDFSPAAIEERFRVESKEAKAAVKSVFDAEESRVDDLRSLGSVFDAEEFQIGMPFGAIMTCMGMYQMWKLSPSTCIDVAMYYAFYKLSVIAADVRRRGFSPDWIIRIKLGIIIAVLAKELGNQGGVPLDFIRLGIFSIYAFSVMWDVKGLKKYASKCFLHVLFHELITGERLAAEETTESHVTEETTESHVAEEMGEGHVTEKMVESHVTEGTYEIHIAEKTGESHITEETVESHVTQKTGESQVITYEMGESHVTRESHVTEEAGECHVTEETGEVHITEETGGSHVTDETGEGHVTEEACESHVREETGESLITEETSEGHVVTEKMGVKAT